ncbi:hypothetical protein BC332_17844 [Capsicum chinense]|nr:hypothetical protein BC332_17844 [Capsicum chinense]
MNILFHPLTSLILWNTSTDPTKLPDPLMPSYALTIYNLYLFEKSKFKEYDSLLGNTFAGCQARANHLALVLENGDTISANGTLINNPLYVSPNSKTYRKLDCLVERRNCEITNKEYDCSLYGNMCMYDYKNIDGSRIRGWIAHNMITFVLERKQESIVFGCGKDQTHRKPFSGQFLELLAPDAMGGGNSLASQYEVGIMSMCLPGVLSTKRSTLSFHTMPFKKTTSATLLQDFRFPSVCFVNLYKVFINDMEVPMFPSLSRNFRNNDTSGSCIVDTGTFITHFPHDFYIVFRYTFR